MIRTTPTLVTAPASEPVTLAEVKAWAKIDGNDEDALLNMLIASAREAAEQYTRRAFITQTWKLTLDLPSSRVGDYLPAGTYDLPVTILNGDFPRTIELPYRPIQSISSVTTTDTSNTETTFSSSNYFVDSANGRLVLNDSVYWPTNLRSSAAMAITYVAGYGLSSSVPKAIKTAIMMQVQKMYDNRGCDDGEMPDSCKNLLRQYRVYA